MKADQGPVDLNQGIEIQIESTEAPKKRPLTSLFSSFARGVGRLARNLGKEAATYAGVLGLGTRDFVKNTASTGLDAIRRTANRGAHPRGGPLYDTNSKVSDTSAEKASDNLKNAASSPNELSYNQAENNA